MKTRSRLYNSRKPVLLISMLALLALALVACQSKATPTATQVPAAPAPTNTTAPTAAPAVAEPTIMVATDPKLGQILVDSKGMTLYLYTTDKPNQSNCATSCLAYWPPLLTQGHPVAGTGVDASLLGSTTLGDGRKIVTYNGNPLYYWIKDKNPGDTTGQGVQGVWFVVSPQGMKVEAPAAGSTATATAAAAAFQEPTINVATSSTLGQILADGNGMTLYAFAKDGPDKSNCAGKCLTLWPPLLTQGHPGAGMGVDASLIGTAVLTDGQTIVTYNHMPLYTWSKDTKAGDTTGEGVASVWFVVSPAGKTVEPPATAAVTPTTAAAFQEPTIMVATDPKLGQILVDGKGMTLYIYTVDKPNQSNCDATCLAYWPPLVTQGHPVAGTGVNASLLGTATLADGWMIVTYNGMPLYYFVKDAKAGDTTGQGAQKVWYVIGPDGKVIGQ